MFLNWFSGWCSPLFHGNPLAGSNFSNSIGPTLTFVICGKKSITIIIPNTMISGLVSTKLPLDVVVVVVILVLTPEVTFWTTILVVDLAVYKLN
jgi:hypothetical protein